MNGVFNVCSGAVSSLLTCCIIFRSGLLGGAVTKNSEKAIFFTCPACKLLNKLYFIHVSGLYPDYGRHTVNTGSGSSAYYGTAENAVMNFVIKILAISGVNLQ